MEAHQEFLQAVHDHFRATGEWPLLKPLQLKLRHVGHLPKLAAEIGKDKILCDHQSQNGTCRLTLRGVAAIEGEESDIAHFIHVVRALVRHSIESESDSIKLSDLIADLNLTDLEIRRIRELIRLSSGLWNGLSSGESEMTLTPSPEIWYFEKVESLADYEAALQRAREDERAANRPLPGYTLPPPPLNPSQFDGGAAGTARTDFVDRTRLEGLRSLKQTAFDLRRLIAMCEELNTCANNDCLHATAMLTRAITDHVPPIFNAKTFDEVANNHPGGKSFKDSMKHLTKSARSIANAHLHVQIRSKETLPSRTQVDFSRDLDVLLAEIVRTLS
jgi:hypothetical protein